MLRADEEDVVGLTIPHRPEQTRNQLDQAARLLELLVLLEECDDVLETRMERVGGGDLVGNRLGAAVGGLGLGGFFQLAAIGVGDVLDLRLVGQRLEKTLAQDVVDLVRGEIDRRDGAFLAAEFGACVFERTIDESCAGVVGRREVGDDDADILLLAGRREKIGEGASGDIGDRAVTHLLRVEIVEVGRHLVEQDENGMLALEELEPVLFVRGLRAARPERFELIPFAELVGDLAPKEVVGIVAAVESSDVGAPKGRGMGHPRAVCFSEAGMFGEQAEADEKVGLAAAHRLLEVEDRLGRGPRQPGDALGDEVLHTLSDVRLLEEGRAIALGGDQLIELLDLIAELDRERIVLKLAGVADGFHSCFPRVPNWQFVCIHFNTTESGTRAALWGARAIGQKPLATLLIHDAAASSPS